jgi:hypothetical protein
MANDRIVVRGAREHTKAIDLEAPGDQLVVITGLSGSGKSSLAFDTIYAEGQRRYVESPRLRPAVSRERWRAGRGLDRGLARHLDRAEDDLKNPLDGGHVTEIRLPVGALRAGRDRIAPVR